KLPWDVVITPTGDKVQDLRSPNTAQLYASQMTEIAVAARRGSAQQYAANAPAQPAYGYPAGNAAPPSGNPPPPAYGGGFAQNQPARATGRRSLRRLARRTAAPRSRQRADRTLRERTARAAAVSAADGADRRIFRRAGARWRLRCNASWRCRQPLRSAG